MVSLFPDPDTPSLPEFHSILIEGDYSPTSPLYVCLSHLSEEEEEDARPIIITAASRSSFIKCLTTLNDRWLGENAGLGSMSHSLSQIRIFYPESTSHWVFFFSLLQSGLVPALQMDPPVSMIVLHEPSAYLLDKEADSPLTVHSYLRLITCAFSAVVSLGKSGRRTKLVVFDSRLQELSLPVLPTQVADPEAEGHVLAALTKYFQWVGHVEPEDDVYKMTLSRPSLEEIPMVLKWQHILEYGKGSIFLPVDSM